MNIDKHSSKEFHIFLVTSHCVELAKLDTDKNKVTYFEK